MENLKKNIIQFLVWMRNGTAFCITWFLILILIHSYIFNNETISITFLTKLVFLTIGGVYIFCMMFTRLFIRKWSFLTRLTCFMVSIGIYECFGFNYLGILSGEEKIIQWFIFLGILLVSYFIGIVIYQKYSKKKGEIYTEALQKYQQERKIINEE